MQSGLKIGFALAERVRRAKVGRCHPEGDSAWQLWQLAVALGSMLGGPLFCFLAQTGLETLLLHCRDSIYAPFSLEECTLVGGP